MSLDKEVTLTLTVGARFPTRAGFGVLNAFTAEDGPIGAVERSRAYSSSTAVANDYGSDSEIAKIASAYFGQNPKPQTMRVSARFDADQAAQLRGGGIADTAENLATFTAITDGSFVISIEGTSETIAGLDFSAQTTMAGVATVLQGALAAEAAGTTCTYDGRFTIVAPTPGESSTISQATPHSAGTDVSGLLRLNAGNGIVSSGIDAETITESLNRTLTKTSDFFGIIFTKEVREAVTIEGEDAVNAAATWALANDRVFFNTTNDPDSLDSVSGGIGATLKANTQSATLTTYSSYPEQYPSASIAGRAFSVNFDGVDTTITLKFKQLPGITVETLSDDQLRVLEGHNINTYISNGGVSYFTDSRMADGVFFDEVHGLAWLRNAIQVEVFGGLATEATKAPYTDAGAARSASRCTNALEQGVANGLLAPGTLSTGEFLPLGYQVNLIPVADVSQSNVEARHYPGLSFIGKGAGAIHNVTITGVFER